jgi:hypothetical protein
VAVLEGAAIQLLRGARRGGVVFDTPKYPFVGGLLGVDYALFEGVRGWLEITPKLVIRGLERELIIGGRFGLRLEP